MTSDKGIGRLRISFEQGDISSEFVDRLISERSSVAIDIETSGLDYRESSIGAIQIYDGADAVIVRPPYKRPTNMSRLLENDQVIKVFHHAMFDLRFLSFCLNINAKNVQCTKIAAKITLPHLKKHSLIEIVEHYLDLRLDKAEQTSNWMLDALSEDQVSYAVRDVIYLFRLRNLLMQDAMRKKLRPLLQKSFDYIPTRVRLDLAGIGDVFVY